MIEGDCNYCDLTSLNSFNISDSITHLNIRSLRNKSDELNSIISMLHFPNVIYISETWLEINEHIENLNNYFFISAPRINRNGGGVGAYIRNDLRFQINFKLYNDLNAYNDIDFLLFFLIDQNINLAVMYCPPGINHNVCLNN